MATSIRLIQVSTISGDKDTDIHNAKLMTNTLATRPTAGWLSSFIFSPPYVFYVFYGFENCLIASQASPCWHCPGLPPFMKLCCCRMHFPQPAMSETGL
jgi:hypothetical protein